MSKYYNHFQVSIEDLLERVEVSKEFEAQYMTDELLFAPMLYHISDKLYPNLKSLALQNPTDRNTSHSREINFLLAPISTEDKVAYIKAGFKRWGTNINDPLYLYIVDSSKIEKTAIVNITSTPQQRTYDKRHWHMDDVSDEDFPKARREYMDNRTKFLRRMYKIPSNSHMEAFTKHAQYPNWSHHQWVDKNLLTGSKEQYASDIPHLQVLITKPVEYVKVFKI